MAFYNAVKVTGWSGHVHRKSIAQADRRLQIHRVRLTLKKVILYWRIGNYRYNMFKLVPVGCT